MGKHKIDGEEVEIVNVEAQKKKDKKKDKKKRIEESHQIQDSLVDPEELKKELKLRKKKAKQLGLAWDKSAEKKALKKELKERSKQNTEDEGEVDITQTDPVIENAKGDEKDKKKRKEKRTEKQKNKSNVSSDDLAKTEQMEAEAAAKAAKKEKKKLRKERKQLDEVAEEDGKEAENTLLKEPSKKRKRLNEEKHDTPSNVESSKCTGSKDDMSKRAKVEGSSTNLSGAEQWNPDALSGDAARKNKFLRLLGAGKAGVSGLNSQAQGKAHSANKAAEISRVQDELERQFNSGIQMKHDGMGRRRGLGS